MPAIVVRDDPDLIALYWPAGTPNKDTGRRVSPQDLLADQAPTLVDGHWTRTDVLMLIPPTTLHAVYAMWETGPRLFLCWYVNLQSPLQRTLVGFDGIDYMLDIVISPDRSSWHWKDEDEFNEAVSIGVYPTELAQAIRAEGEAVIRQMQAGLPPFCDSWESWSPPKDWPIPDFPAGWERL